MNITISYPLASSTGAVANAQLLERQLDHIGMVINSNARVAEGKTDLTFAANKGPTYAETLVSSNLRCFGKHYVPTYTSNADDTIIISDVTAPTVYRDNATFGVVTIPANCQAILEGAKSAWFHVGVNTPAAGAASIVPRTGAAANQFVVRPNLTAVGTNASEGIHPFALGVSSWTPVADTFYTAFFKVRIISSSFQLRIGTGALGNAAATMVVFKLAGWSQ